MATTTDVPAVRKTGWLRFRFPYLVLLLAAVVIAVAWWLPFEEMERMKRVFITELAIMVSALTVLLWFVGFSGASWPVRLLGLALVPIAYLGSVREFHFDGDMVPVVQWRWQATTDDVLDAHRKNQGTADAPALPPAEATDFPEYRGRKRDGIVIGPTLSRDWQTKPPAGLWPKQPIGGGFAAFAVAGPLLVTIEQRRDKEAVVAYDAVTGKQRWQHEYDANFKEALGGPGPRATPTIADGMVYSLGATGNLVCLDAATGERRWAVNILEDNDNIPWGMSGSPLVYDKVVVVNSGCQREGVTGRGLVAYDRATGQQVWQAGDGKAGYSSPMLATLGGGRQVLILDGEALAGHDAADGRELWRFPWPTHQNINVAQPLVIDGDRVYISSGYGHGGALLRIENAQGQWTATPVWQNLKLRCKFTSPVLYRGHIYGIDEGLLTCLDVETGKQKWRDGRYGHGQLLLTGDLLVILAEDGKLALVEATPEGHRELAKMPALEGKTWNLPALSRGIVYLRNDHEMACFDLK